MRDYDNIFKQEELFWSQKAMTNWWGKVRITQNFSMLMLYLTKEVQGGTCEGC